MRYIIISLAVVVSIGLIIFAGRAGGPAVSGENAKQGNTHLIADTSSLPHEGKAPELVGIDGWINTKPLSMRDLKGKVVLVDFWTYSCINCIRTFPYLKGWYEKYKDSGFVILGLHAPEFEFEKNKDNVDQAIKKYGLAYPVALDSEHATWNAYANQYWPAHYLIDAKGDIRYHHFGEGSYEETESAIQKVLLEDGLLTVDKITQASPPPESDLSHIASPEMYFGYLRINNLGNVGKEARPDQTYTFSLPEKFEENRFYLGGMWAIRPEFAELVGDKGTVVLRYKADKVNMVLGFGSEASNAAQAESSDGAPVMSEVKLDGMDLATGNGGTDVDIKANRSFFSLKEARLYNLVKGTGDGAWHTIEITFLRKGVRAFTFTFG